INRAFAVALGVGLAACVVPEDEVEVGEVVQEVKKCDNSDFCTTNSPIIKIYGTYAFRLDGVRNNEGFALLGMSQRNRWYKLAVRDSRITARDRNDNIVLEHE